jgi:hypothetical protein
VAQERLDIAHQSWDRGWGQAETRAQPEQAVTELIPALVDRGARRVLDVGTGIGRHVLAFARAGFEVIALAWNVLYHGDADVVRVAPTRSSTMPARETRTIRISLSTPQP